MEQLVLHYIIINLSSLLKKSKDEESEHALGFHDAQLLLALRMKTQRLRGGITLRFLEWQPRSKAKLLSRSVQVIARLHEKSADYLIANLINLWTSHCNLRISYSNLRRFTVSFLSKCAFFPYCHVIWGTPITNYEFLITIYEFPLCLFYQNVLFSFSSSNNLLLCLFYWKFNYPGLLWLLFYFPGLL